MGKKVMVVDDSPFMRSMIKGIVLQLGCEVVAEASDGGEAITKASQFRPDIVTMDIVMPKVSGIDGLAGIKKENPQIKVIMISAIDQKESLIQAVRLGASGFIVKPFDENNVKATLQKLL